MQDADKGTLWAKSGAEGTGVGLFQHCQDVLETAHGIFGTAEAPTPFASRWLRFFKLPPTKWRLFIRSVELAALLHDLGKANDGFQNRLRHKGEQVLRHEHLSALLLWSDPLRTWLFGSDAIQPETVLAGVASHHLKASPRKDHFPEALSNREIVRVFAECSDFRRIIDAASAILGVTPPDLNALDGVWDLDDKVYPLADRFLAHMAGFNRSLGTDEPANRLLLAVKAALVAADSAASACFREGLDIRQWLGVCFDSSPFASGEIRSKVIEPRIRDIENRSGHPFEWQDFQSAMDEVGPRALLIASCGAGKTLAAWRWIETQTLQRPVQRVLFLYPTRATATEGFRDYASWAGGEEAALMHGTSAYDVVGLFNDGEDPRKGEDFTTSARLFALGYWPRRIFSATVDAFLAFMAQQYASLCMLPVLSESVVVIDEVHSFSPSMFKALEGFLKFFDVPVLCMTATLPQDRLSTLTGSCNLQLYPDKQEQFQQLQTLANADRYRLAICTHDETLGAIKDALREGRRVLWVANTVDRCQRNALVFERWCREKQIPRLCYHSRYRLKDRKRRHEDVIALFRNCQNDGALVTTTQVCQMSLDLDADLLVSEVAPMADLIQRMGRCNRSNPPRPIRTAGDVLIYPPPSAAPYKPADIDQTLAAVEGLAGSKVISQNTLSQALETLEPMDPHMEGAFTAFLGSGWYASARDDSFREESYFTVDAVLDSDVHCYLEAKRLASDAEGFVVHVPRSQAHDDSALGRWLKAAPAECYDEFYGFMKQEVRDAQKAARRGGI